jgi:hypothetical protein
MVVGDNHRALGSDPMMVSSMVHTEEMEKVKSLKRGQRKLKKS